MKTKLLAFLLLLPFLSIGQQYQLITSNETNITIDIQAPEFQTQAVVTPQGEAFVVTAPKAMNRAEAGEPDLPLLVIPTVIGDDALMQVEVIESEYTDYQNINIAPSKGDFPRSVNPEDVPYTYGEAYQRNAFFPTQLVQLDEPYIHRDVRGQNLVVYPYTYNPVTKVLRVYTHLVVSMDRIGHDDRNVIVNRTRSFKLDPEFKALYEHRYINYQESLTRYTPIEENGELLIICHDDFMTAMEPFVAWKKQIGRPTTMVGTSETGNTSSAIKTYIENYYANNPNLTDILLVGDVAQIPGMYINAGTGYYGYSGYGDAQYGQTAGNDYYNELIVGRFCCENEAQVINHVNKVLNYERDLDETATWLSVGQGVSKNEGAGSGHYGEADYEHIDYIRDDLLGYNYTEVHRDYQGVTGVTSSAAIISQHINEGVSIINYCNHGSETSWGVFSYSNSHVNALTNDYKLPYVISVACLNGKYDHGGNGCFAEAWMRATNNSNGNPTGAIGGMFSYISQPWTPPQYGQDEMVDILVELQANNIKHTMGGVSINGNMKVLDQGASQNAVKGTYNTWILFGDPTLTLRNATPTPMTVSHDGVLDANATTYTVNVVNGEDALATLTFEGEILGSAVVTNGVANIGFEAPATPGEAVLTVFGYNKVSYTAPVTVGGNTLTVSATANPRVIALGGSSTLSANVVGGSGDITYNWSPATSLNNPNIMSPVATPTETTDYSVTVARDGMTQTAQVTVQVVTPPTNLTATVANDNDIVLSWNAPELVSSYIIYQDGNEVYNSIATTTFTIPDNEVGTYSFEVAAQYRDVISPRSNAVTVTIEQTTCPAPENFKGEYYWDDGEFGARLAWDRAEYNYTLDRFEIYRSTDGENFELANRIVNTPSITHYECRDQLEEAGRYIYRIIAFYQNNCESDPVDTEVAVTSIGESSTHVDLYPNPTTGLVNIKAEGMKLLTVANAMGQVVLRSEVSGDEALIDLSALGNGMYLLNITTGQGTIVKKLNVLK
ncbi:MAG: T9SS type A sorting domain-containing protein [Bacteroidales bacterium]|nr:T9SS type A sorting domain-containing protein [Bacteroidales bacterium]